MDDDVGKPLGDPTAPGGAPTPSALAGMVPGPTATPGWVRGALWVATSLILLLLPPSGALQIGALCLAGAGFLWLLWPVRTAPRETAWSPLLLVAGALMLVAPFLFANPWSGSQATEWPWVQWGNTSSWAHRIDLVLWVIVSVLTLLVGFGVGGRRLAPALVAAAFFLSARALARTSGYGMLRLDRMNLAWAVSSTALGAGLLRLAGRGESGRGAARALSLAGVLGIVWIYASWFPMNGDRVEPSLRLQVRELQVMWDRVVLGAEHDPELWARLRDQVWAVSLPFLCQVLALVIGLALALFGASPGDRGRRFAAALGWLLLLLTFLLAPRAGLYVEWAEYEQRGMTKVCKVLGELLMSGGLCAWLVLCGATLRVLGTRPGAGPVPLEPPRPPAGRWPYAVAALLALGVLHASFQPEHGIVAPQGIRALVTAGEWTPGLADLCLQALFFVAMLWGAVAPSRTVGLASGVLLVVWGVYWPTSASSERMYEIETWVPGAIAALCAAGAWALAVADRRPRGARFVAAAAALILLALLVYPISVVVPKDGRPMPAVPPYEGYLPTEVVRAAYRTETWGARVEGLLLPRSTVVVVHALLGLVTLILVGTGARVAGRIAFVLFLVALAYPVLHTCLDPRGASYVLAGMSPDSWAGWEQRIGGALKHYHTAYELAVFAAVSTLFRPSPGRAPTLRAPARQPVAVGA